MVLLGRVGSNPTPGVSSIAGQIAGLFWGSLVLAQDLCVDTSNFPRPFARIYHILLFLNILGC